MKHEEDIFQRIAVADDRDVLESFALGSRPKPKRHLIFKLAVGFAPLRVGDPIQVLPTARDGSAAGLRHLGDGPHQSDFSVQVSPHACAEQQRIFGPGVVRGGREGWDADLGSDVLDEEVDARGSKFLQQRPKGRVVDGFEVDADAGVARLCHDQSVSFD
nr:hypothetical protein [uncultured bacterium]